MHMANELLSVPVAGGTLAVAAAGLGLICRKVSRIVTSDKLPLMGVLGAFIFAAQMVNFQLPAMPGTSGHMVGSVLLSIVLGPHLAAVVISSVIIVQCLIFQDGGLLALGCNIINMGLVPCYVGYFLYRTITVGKSGSMRTYVGAMLACVVALEAGAILVPVEAALSGVLAVPFSTFLVTMVGVHFLVGLVEGLITVTVLAYLQQVRPDLVLEALPGRVRLSRKTVMVTLLVFAIVAAAGLSLLASKMPDGLEWSYLERPDQPGFKPIITNENPTTAAVDKMQAKYTPLPDYSVHGSSSAGWTSFAGVAGSTLTMALIWAVATLLRRRQSKCTTHI
jgi:cobalt/nickel transport system permease protein